MRKALFISMIALTACSETPTAVDSKPPATIAGPDLNLSGVVFQPGNEANLDIPGSFNVVASLVTSTCSFTTTGMTMLLDGDCTTDGTILIPEGMTLDGDGHTITAVDPPGDHFRGAVVQNGGAWAAVRRLTVTVSGLANVCDAGGDRLRGIMFEGASGEIVSNTVVGVNQGPSGCQEGNAIEVRNEPFDGTHPNTQTVVVSHNRVDLYQKGGIIINGDVNVDVKLNSLGASATQQNLAANGIQLGFGAIGLVQYNVVGGNQWLGASDFAATGILIFDASAATVIHNRVNGNADIGLFVIADGGIYEHNDIRDFQSDGPHGDFGVADVGNGNVFNNSLVCGFDTPYFPIPIAGIQNQGLPDPACSR